MKTHFIMMATYNRWANARLYAMATRLPEEALKRPVGVYFKSLHGTLNHLLVADRIWMSRLEGTVQPPGRLDAIVHDDLASLRAARKAEDERILRFVESLQAAEFDRPLIYKTLASKPQQRPVRDVLAHFFNHQTHHRGQAHAALTILGVAEPDSLDLLQMQREIGNA
jgi:uncharacterized damage-inducible protein DinB